MINVINIVKQKGFTMAILAIVTLLCIYVSTNINPNLGLVIGMLPIIFIFTYLCIYKQYITLIILFIINYTILGIGRYISFPIPVSGFFDILYCFIITTIVLNNLIKTDNFRNVFNIYLIFTLIWFSYCLINLGNHTTGTIHFSAWFTNVRGLALYAILTCIIISIIAKKYHFIKHLLIIWGILTILAAIKGYWQKNYGFDTAEMTWLLSGGYRTHFLHTGIRYFSFFTDAANFGCSMGLSLMVYFISLFYVKNRYFKLFCLCVTIASTYGLLISGTRAAMAVPIAGLGLFIFICKNWKIGFTSAVILIVGLFMLKYTTIGNGNRLIRRMRTIFDTEDASMNVRYENQKALKAYMSEIPFGIGLGVTGEEVPPQNKYRFVATVAPDSEFVNIWIRMGKVGIIFYLILQTLMYICASFILVFRVKNPEIRGPLTGMLCGTAGMLVASYANQIYFQFPNGPLIYTCLTLVFLAPYFDKQYSEEHGRTS